MRRVRYALATIVLMAAYPAAAGDWYASTFNRVMINDVMAHWFSGTYMMVDAAFDSRNLHSHDSGEVQRQCFQSKTYPRKGIAIEYLSMNGSVNGVIYMPTLAGCGEQS